MYAHVVVINYLMYTTSDRLNLNFMIIILEFADQCDAIAHHFRHLLVSHNLLDRVNEIDRRIGRYES